MLFIMNATNVMFGTFHLQILYIISECINNMHHATYICDSCFFFLNNAILNFKYSTLFYWFLINECIKTERCNFCATNIINKNSLVQYMYCVHVVVQITVAAIDVDYG